MGWNSAGLNLKGPKGDPGAKGDPGQSVTIKGRVATHDSLPANAANGDGYITEDTGHLWVWIGGTGFTDVGQITGPPGNNGADGRGIATIAVAGDGTVTITYTDGQTAQVGNAKGPTGSTGAPGAAATVQVGNVQTGAAGSAVQVTNSGTSAAAVLDFTIPRGNLGNQGATGDPGVQGPRGPGWASGHGAPGTITGAITGDLYLDVDSGDVWTNS